LGPASDHISSATLASHMPAYFAVLAALLPAQTSFAGHDARMTSIYPPPTYAAVAEAHHVSVGGTQGAIHFIASESRRVAPGGRHADPSSLAPPPRRGAGLS
jgi:hypothetical protein